jgi:type II secretory pathway pseudopilin PulG
MAERAQARAVTEAPPATDEAPSEELRRAHSAVNAAQEAYRRAHARRPAVTATGRALERTNSRNHLADLVRGALGSGS